MEVITIIAIFVGPIAAVLVTRYIDYIRQKKERRLSIFRDLMTTRRLKLDGTHVNALNLIELEFYGKKRVIESYQKYLSHLSSAVPSRDEFPAYDAKTNDLYLKLLQEIGKCVGYSFDKHDLQHLAYLPQATGNLLEIQMENYHLLNRIMSGEKSLSVSISKSEAPAQKNLPG